MFFNHPLKPFLIVVLIFSLIACLVYYAGVRINLDTSHATLFWRVSSKPVVPQRGRYIVVCFPISFIMRHELNRHFNGRGRCGGILPMLKQIVATENDDIAINQNGIKVNGVVIAHSRPLPQLSRITDKRMKVPKGKILIAGQTNDSLDSRYFGLVEVKWIEYSATPLF